MVATGRRNVDAHVALLRRSAGAPEAFDGPDGRFERRFSCIHEHGQQIRIM
jgi:hypothetical protein